MTDSKPNNDLQPPASDTFVPKVDPVEVSGETLSHGQPPARTLEAANAKAGSQTQTHQSTGDDLKQPNERDESGDSQPMQTQDNKTLIGQAKKDLDSGKVDTDRRVPMESVYEKQKEGSNDGARGEPRR